MGACEVEGGLVQRCACEVGAVVLGLAVGGALLVEPRRQCGVFEVCASQVGCCEVCVSERRSLEVGADEFCAFEVGAGQVGTLEIGT